MKDFRTKLCFACSRKLIRQPRKRNIDKKAYSAWREESLSKSYSSFSSTFIENKDVLDFGCGEGELSFYLARTYKPKSMVGIDIDEPAIEKARIKLTSGQTPRDVKLRFDLGTTNRIPLPDQNFDTLLAFDCMEHIMAPRKIMAEWFRILRPGGRCLIEWYPFNGPWGPHMEVLVPIPWAHVIFGERAMFRTAEMIYDLPEFTPRHWDLDNTGNKKPNKWKKWSSFHEQGYLNELDINDFQRIAQDIGFNISRLERRGFSGSPLKRGLGCLLINLPFLGKYFTSYVIIELEKPRQMTL
jgi:SAM-dependent methyltransferase